MTASKDQKIQLTNPPTYADAYLERSNVFNSIGLSQRTVDRISRYKPIVAKMDTEIKGDLINELTPAQEILKKHFLLTLYERRYVNIAEMEKLYAQIKKGDEMLAALKNPAPASLDAIEQYNISDYNKHEHFKWISFVNDKRLTALWFRLMLPELLNSCHSTDPEAKLAVPNEIAGDLSFGLYGVRDIYQIMHILNISYGTLPTEEKEKLKTALKTNKVWSPFWTHMWESKYQLTNDTVWGVDNALEYFKKIDPSILGGVGDPIGMGLFAMDFILQIGQFYEDRAKHIERKEIINKIANTEHHDREILEESHQWKYKEQENKNNCLYAFAICIGFAMFCLCPPVLIGATFLVGITFIYNVFGTKGLDIDEAKERKLLIKKETDKYVNALKLKTQEVATTTPVSEISDPKIQMLCIDILANKQKLIDQDNIIAKRQRAQKVTAVLNILIPVLSFTCICLLPTGVGFAAVLGVMLVILALKFCVYDKIIEATEKESQDKHNPGDIKKEMGIILDTKDEFDVAQITMTQVLKLPDDEASNANH